MFDDQLQQQITTMVGIALQQDIGEGDITTNWTIPKDFQGRAVIVSKDVGVFCGGIVLQEVFSQVDEDLQVRIELKEGEEIRKGTLIATIEGSLRSLITAERTALNFVQRASGVASLAARYCSAVDGTGVTIVDTRKTLPGFRRLDKYAVRCGGAKNHRMGLDDMVLIKDNHSDAVGGVGEAIRRVYEARKSQQKDVKVAVEVRNPEELDVAVSLKPFLILLDNMSPATIRQELRRVKPQSGSIRFEATGNINLETVRSYAESGVDRISVGALTHSATAMDISMLVG